MVKICHCHYLHISWYYGQLEWFYEKYIIFWPILQYCYDNMMKQSTVMIETKNIYQSQHIILLNGKHSFIHAAVSVPMIESCKIMINKYQNWLCFGLVPAQDVHFLYVHSHLSAPQSCKWVFSANYTLNSSLW